MGISVEQTISKGVVGTYTWSARPSASSYPAGTQVRVSNVGASGAGSVWVSTGSAWVPENGSVILFQSAAAVTAPANDTNENTLASNTIPGGVPGPNGGLRITLTISHTNNSNNKTIRVKLGGTTFQAYVVTTTGTGSVVCYIMNRNSEASQVCRTLATTGSLTGNASTVTGTENTATDLALTITGQKATGTDTLTLESYTVELVRFD